jgi:putative hydrolase
MFGSNDPDNPMGGLLGDLLKVIGTSAPGGSGAWFDAARTLAHGVATDTGDGTEENADPLVRIAFEELTRVAELHVADATGISLDQGGAGISLTTVGPGQWSFRLLDAYRPTLQLMVDAQQQAAASVPPSSELLLPEEGADGLSGLIGQLAITLGPILLGMQFGSAAGHLAKRAFGQYSLPLPWPESNTLLLVPANVAQFAEDWSLPLQEVQLWVCLRELTMHAVITRPAVRSSLTTLLGDAAAHAAASQRSLIERLGDGLGDPTTLENVLGDPEAILADLISPEQQHLSNALTAQTTAITAYVDHVTAGIAATLTSSPAALREAWYRYRVEAAKGEQAFAGLFGLNVGQEEVDRGSTFINGVVERAGEGALSRLWTDEMDLPTPAEVDAPGLWLARIGLLD